MHIDEEVVYFIGFSSKRLISYTYIIRTDVCETHDSQGRNIFWVITPRTLVEFTTSEIPLASTFLLEYLSVLRLKCTLLLLSSSSSSSSPLCRVFIFIFLRQTMFLGNTVLQLFCCYYSWRLDRVSVETIVILH